MSNISDNLRDFFEKPYDIENWVLKKEFYITLSVILELQNNEEVLGVIKNFQEEIIKKISDNVDIFNNPYETKGLYKYPKEDFHFSLINFFKYENADELNEEDENINTIKDYLSKNLYNNMPSEIKADLRWIESGTHGRPLDSFSLQVFPDPLFIKNLKKINTDLSDNIFKIKPKNSDFTLKAYPEKNSRRFPLNILRFIDKATENGKINEEIKVKIKNIVENINMEHNNKPLFTFNITKLSLVKSDPFLFKSKEFESGEISCYVLANL